MQDEVSLVFLGHRFLLTEWFDAILRHQFLGIGIIVLHAGGGDEFALLNLRGNFWIQGEELGRANPSWR